VRFRDLVTGGRCVRITTPTPHPLGSQLATFFARNSAPKRTDPHLLQFIRQFPIIQEETGRSRRSGPQIPAYPADWVVDISLLRKALKAFAEENADSIAIIAATSQSSASSSIIPSVNVSNPQLTDSETPATPQEKAAATSQAPTELLHHLRGAPHIHRRVDREIHARPLTLRSSSREMAAPAPRQVLQGSEPPQHLEATHEQAPATTSVHVPEALREQASIDQRPIEQRPADRVFETPY
jgi:hypothetical protein